MNTYIIITNNNKHYPVRAANAWDAACKINKINDVHINSIKAIVSISTYCNVIHTTVYNLSGNCESHNFYLEEA